jgi:hypothetical protein
LRGRAFAIAEPMTLATDVLLAGLAGWLGVRLWRAGAGPDRRSVRLWAAAFFATAAAALLGGAWHGFAPSLGAAAGAVLWKLTLAAAGSAGFCMLAGTLYATVRRPWRGALLALAAAKLVLYAAWMAVHDDFVWVVLDYGTAMLAVLALHGWAGLRRREPASGWMVAGVVVAALAAAIQQSDVALHRHLDANDLYHLVQMASLWLFYRGARRLADRAG